MSLAKLTIPSVKPRLPMIALPNAAAPGALALRWRFGGYSPTALATGQWPQAAAA